MKFPTFKKTLKVILYSVLGIIICLVIGITAFLYASPQFGKQPSDEQKVDFEKSPQFAEGKFENLGKVKMDIKFVDYFGMIFKFFKSQPNTIPVSPLPQQTVDSLSIADYRFEKTKIIWFGHSSILLQMNGKTILIDPMFSDVPAPHPSLGSPRFNKDLPIELEKLGSIDAVILSHDHYDHLDYESIKKLKDKALHYYTPLGVGSHLQSWGIDSSKITELDWWHETVLGDLKFICTPSQHFSGRGLSDGNATLWGSWIIQSKTENIYFSGDSGYGAHFKEIGVKYGPFDFAMMECGQYNEQWKEIHMLPEETAQAALDLNSRVFMPIHWGAFKLAMHPWNDPAIRVDIKAKELNVSTYFPIIGEAFYLSDSLLPTQPSWWRNL